MHQIRPSCQWLAPAVLLVFSSAAIADGYKISDGDKFIKIGARIQLQYKIDDTAGGSKTDDIFFRRLRARIEGSAHKNWMGKAEWEIGKASGDNELSVKESWMQYSASKNYKLRIGNSSFPFSREFMTAFAKQQLVERTFVGDLNYGTPDKNTGVHVYGNNADKSITWRASTVIALMAPNDKKLRFGTPVNKPSKFNEGFMVGGRVDYHPFGYLPFSQGDFSGKTKATIGIAAYTWSNDDDKMVNDPTVGADIDSVTAFEISGGFRSSGFSVDLQYNSFDAETVQAGLTNGIYTNSKTTLTNTAVEGGYMIDNTVELVAGYQVQDADGYASQWKRTSVGANWFINGLDTKIALSWRTGNNLDGVLNNDKDEIFLQAQFLI